MHKFGLLTRQLMAPTKSASTSPAIGVLSLGLSKCLDLSRALIAALLARLLLLFSTPAAFAGTVNQATITTVAISASIGNTLFIAVNKTKDTNPACQNNGTWAYVVSLDSVTGKNLYALLLAARAVGAPVNLSGTGACDVFGSVETLLTAFY